MNQSLSNNTVMLPSDIERQQIFYWLKKLSSVTAWRRILEYYQAWADATENSLRAADHQGWGHDTSLPQAEYALILKCLAHCEEGVNRLSRGDKRIFKFDANGEFIMAQRMLTHWSQMLYRIELGENGINKNSPLWAEFCETLTSLGQAWGSAARIFLSRVTLQTQLGRFTAYGCKRNWHKLRFQVNWRQCPTRLRIHLSAPETTLHVPVSGNRSMSPSPPC